MKYKSILKGYGIYIKIFKALKQSFRLYTVKNFVEDLILIQDFTILCFQPIQIQNLLQPSTKFLGGYVEIIYTHK